MPSAWPVRYSPVGRMRRAIQRVGRKFGVDLGAGLEPAARRRSTIRNGSTSPSTRISSPTALIASGKYLRVALDERHDARLQLGHRCSMVPAGVRRRSPSARPRTHDPVVVLGIDPGLACTGFGVVRVEGQRVTALAHGDIPTRPRDDPGERLHRIHEGIVEVLARTRPTRRRSSRSSSGSIRARSSRSGRRAGSRSPPAALRASPRPSTRPAQVKRAVCGSGRAPKEQVGQHDHRDPRPRGRAAVRARRRCARRRALPCVVGRAQPALRAAR